VLTPICQAFLSALNLHWTLQLVEKQRKGGKAEAGGEGGGAGGARKYDKHL